MTNFERIKIMSKEELADIIDQINSDFAFFSSWYCRNCEHNTHAVGMPAGCSIPEDEIPCRDMSNKDDIVAWLNAEVNQEDK